MASAGGGPRFLRPRLVGAFTVVGLILLLAAMATLSWRTLFVEYRTFVVFFPNAVGGLKPGAPVTFRQVPLGQVRDIDLVFTGRGLNNYIMVVIEIRRGALRNLTAGEAGNPSELSDADLAAVFVLGGLRAVVRSSSPVAGQKSVDLDFHPELAPRFARIETPYPELPTAPTGMEVLNERLEATLKKLSEVPLDQVLLQLGSTLASTQKLLDKGDIEGAMRNLRLTLETANRTLSGAEKTLGHVDGLVAGAQRSLGQADQTMATLGTTLERMDVTLVALNRNLEHTGEVQFEATKALAEMNEVMKSLRSLVDTLQQHPEALLRGKPKPEAGK